MNGLYELFDSMSAWNYYYINVLLITINCNAMDFSFPQTLKKKFYFYQTMENEKYFSNNSRTLKIHET